MAIKAGFCISGHQVQGAPEPSGCRTNPGRLVSDADATLAVGRDTDDTNTRPQTGKREAPFNMVEGCSVVWRGAQKHTLYPTPPGCLPSPTAAHLACGSLGN